MGWTLTPTRLKKGFGQIKTSQTISIHFTTLDTQWTFLMLHYDFRSQWISALNHPTVRLWPLNASDVTSLVSKSTRHSSFVNRFYSSHVSSRDTWR
ncbi:hypothetical protein TNIN_154091 [Trichonephila inaurata madagascariensis]|uniref:Uncharacterized protein n=1 Tax=Trichonephila inaurata madagascariensis TaxID=2747483 RepID=A0A8X6XXR0_9ARAC|nr:hypothetical protein TNIN_154091 [Trichonephila inaurata madagascariensis]